MPKNRLESFSDCIIAFAITLLVLEIHFPDLAATVDNRSMWSAIIGLLPNFAIYLISFLICTVWWISHHALIHDLHFVDRTFLWMNSLFLMWIAFLPFPTGILGHHPLQPVATAVYGAVCAATGLSFWLMRWYASVPGRLMRPDIEHALLLRRVRISLLSPACYLLGTATSFVSPFAAVFIYAAIPAYFAIAKLSHGSSGKPAEPQRAFEQH